VLSSPLQAAQSLARILRQTTDVIVMEVDSQLIFYLSINLEFDHFPA
jgi:hypothetical protein